MTGTQQYERTNVRLIQGRGQAAGDRRIHLIDLENLVGGTAGINSTDCTGILGLYQAHIGIQAGDHAVLGVGPRLGRLLVGADLHNFQLRVGRGIDGADRALLDSIDIKFAANRFDKLVIASGDHIFSPLADRARQLGMQVWQVSGRGRLSGELARVCPFRLRLRLTGEQLPPLLAA